MTNNKKTILLVNDDVHQLPLYEQVLKNSGYSVCAVNSGRACLDSLKSNIPSLIVLDMQMPEMNGLEVLMHLQEDQDTKSIPVIIFSCLSEDVEEIQSAKKLGAQYLSKLNSLSDLPLAIKKMLGEEV